MVTVNNFEFQFVAEFKGGGGDSIYPRKYCLNNDQQFYTARYF